MAETRDLTTAETEAYIAMRRRFFLAEKTASQSIKQKSRIWWAVDGDENSKYFHGVVRGRLKRNSLKGLNVNGRWVEDPIELMNVVADFFIKHFKEDSFKRPSFSSPSFKKLSPSLNQLLDAPFTEKDIKKAIWNCDGSKSPGPDGFSFSFIKSHWVTVKGDIMNSVREFEIKGRFAKGYNSTFITLIPKVSVPLALNDYREVIAKALSAVNIRLLQKHFQRG